MYRYLPVKETAVSEEQVAYATCGIRVLCADGVQSMETAHIADVSTEYTSVLRLAQLCTEEQLDPVHFPDVIEDFLASI